MLKRNKELQELVKKYKEEEKKKKNTATPKAIAAPTSQDSNLVGGASINNASMMEKSRLRRNEAPKTKTNLLRSEAPKTTVSETFNSEGYANTGKKYGDYYYNNYSQLKDVPIYKDKNGKYYTYYNNKYDLLGTGITGSTMTSKSEQKRQLEEAKKLGFKEQQREKTKEYKKAEKAFSKLQKEYNLTDDELNQYIKSGKLSYKGLKTNLITKSMTDARETANTYRQMLDKGSIKKYENNSLLTAEQRLDLATNNLTKSQKSEFKEDLIRQNKKANSGYNDRPKYGYDGTLSGTIKALGSTINNVGDTLNKNIVQPMNNMKDYYEYGKKQNDLAMEYYNKMENKKNNVEAKQKEMDLYQKFNQDLMTDKSWGAEALRNANTQVESLKRQGIVATASSIAGGLVGTAVNPGAGTIAGAKIGGSIGYTLGSTPYTYKLEAGNQYQALTEMGVPDKIAKKYSRVTGGINAAIESGENVIDLITWGVGTKGSNAVSKEAVNKLVKDYGKEQVEEWTNKGASKVARTAIKSYLQNIGSEALEETSQEATSILGERLAAKESGIKRDVSLKEDLSRALEAGKSAAVSTALTAPISSIGGTLNTNMMNQIETKVNNKINNKTINNNNTTEETQINKQQDNIIDTPQEAQQEVRQEVIEDVQEKPNTQPTISESKINEIVENVTKNSKIEYNQKEIADLKKTLYDEVEKLGAKVEESANFIKSAEQHNFNSNSEEIKSVGRIMEAKNIKSSFDSTPFVNNSESALWSIDNDGKISVVFNPNADDKTIFQNVAVHELTHDLLSNKSSAEVLDKQDILEYISKTPGYDIARKSLEETYSQRYDRNSNEFKELVDEEVIASVLGSKLGNQEFINRLNGERPNLARRIYNWVVDKIDNIGKSAEYKAEKKYWKNVANRFEKAFNMEYNRGTNGADTRFAKSSDIARKIFPNDTTIDDLISDDPRKEKFKKWSNSSNYFKLSFEVMDEINAVVSSKAQKEVNGNYLSFTQHINTDNKTYAIYADILSDNNYSITNAELLKEEVIADVDERIEKQNNGLPVPNKQYEQRKSIVDSKSTRYRGTSKGISEVSTNEQEATNNQGVDKESTRSSREELDNSSFSYRGSHQIENAKSITDIDLDEVKSKIIDIDGYLTNQASHDFNKLKKIVANPNETVKIYRAAPANELNNGDWVTTDKSYAKNVADNNGGKVYTYEVRADQLYYPDNIKELPSLHRLSSFQYIENSNTQTTAKDSQGRALSKDQQEYFKDSKVRDENGQLITVYHGTTEEINIFDKNRLGNNTGAASASEGFFFTDNKRIAEEYSRYARPQYIKDLENEYKRLEKEAQKTGNWDDYYKAYEKYEDAELTYAYNEDNQRTNAENQKEVYLNLTNPLIHDFKGESYRDESYYDLLKQAKENGNDGAMFLNTYDGYGEPGSWDNPMTNIYVAFDSNQIKNIDNTKPTSNDDIRYSKENNKWDAFVNKNFKTKGKITTFGELKQNIPIADKYNKPEEKQPKQENNLSESKTEEIQGMSATKSEVEDAVYDKFEEMMEEYGFDVDDIEVVYLHGSRVRGTAKTNSDLDAVVFYIGNESEDYIFNTINDENNQLEIDGVKVDINPISIDSLSEIDDYIEKSEKYDNEILAKQKNTIDEKIEKEKNVLKISQMSDTKLKETSKTIAEQINKDGGLTLKQRKWVGTSTESEVLDNAISIEDLDPNKIYYTPIGNKTTLDKANKNLKKLGYEESIKYIQNKLSTGERISASDVALSERLIQEAVQKGDTKTAQELIMDTAILGTEYGQTIQALSIIQKLTPEGQLKMLDKIVMREKSKGNKTFEGVEITPEMVEKILKAYNKDGTYNQDDLNRRVEEVKQEIADQLKTTVGEKIDAWRYLSMLGNPKTHIRNIVSNVAMKGAIKYKNALARTMETIIPIKNRTKTWKKSSEVVKDFAKQKATELRDVISGETKYSEKTSIESKKQIFKTKFLDKLYNTNSALLDVEDWLFSKSAFESTFREYLTAHDIKTQQDIDNNPTIVEKAQNYAIEQAQIATFRQYSKIASQINKFERNNKMGGFLTKAVVPFKKTPINIAKAGVNYSPLGLIKNLSYDIIQVKKGNIEASQYIDNLSQGLSGSSIALLGYVLAKAGILKGDDDKDKESKYDSALGNKAYSIKIGNDYYSLSWLSPVGMPLFVGANAYKELEENKNIDMNVVSDMLVSTLNPISEMSLVSGLTDTLTSYEGESSKIMGEIAKSSLKSYVGQFFPTLLSQIASVTDSEKRSTTPSSNSKWKYGEEVLNSIKYKIPFARQTLPTYTDLWGNTQKQSDNIFMRAWETFIAPYSRYENKKKKLDEEIQEVYYKTGNIDVIPGTPNSSITLNKEKYRLSNKEYLQFKKTYGTTANNYIEAIIKNSDYKKATYEDKAKIIDKVYDYALTNAQTEYFKKQKIDMSNYGHKSISNKLDMFKEENYSYDDIADYIIYNYYKYKRD